MCSCATFITVPISDHMAAVALELGPWRVTTWLMTTVKDFPIFFVDRASAIGVLIVAGDLHFDIRSCCKDKSCAKPRELHDQGRINASCRKFPKSLSLQDSNWENQNAPPNDQNQSRPADVEMPSAALFFIKKTRKSCESRQIVWTVDIIWICWYLFESQQIKPYQHVLHRTPQTGVHWQCSDVSSLRLHANQCASGTRPAGLVWGLCTTLLGQTFSNWSRKSCRFQPKSLKKTTMSGTLLRLHSSFVHPWANNIHNQESKHRDRYPYQPHQSLPGWISLFPQVVLRGGLTILETRAAQRRVRLDHRRHPLNRCKRCFSKTSAMTAAGHDLPYQSKNNLSIVQNARWSFYNSGGRLFTKMTHNTSRI